MRNKIQAHLRSMAASILCAAALVAMAVVAAGAVVEHTFVVSLHACMFGSNFSMSFHSKLFSANLFFYNQNWQ